MLNNACKIALNSPSNLPNNWPFGSVSAASVIVNLYIVFLSPELAKEEQDQTFRTGNITPDGFIDEDFEEELGSPSQVMNAECQKLPSLNIYMNAFLLAANSGSMHVGTTACLLSM